MICHESLYRTFLRSTSGDAMGLRYVTSQAARVQ
jgi:hypothetical protein